MPKTTSQIIQGGMGTGVSNWVLARCVSQTGQLGVVSGTVLDTIFARRLQIGDPDGHMRRALKHFPNQDIAKDVLKDYFIEGGKDASTAYKRIPMYSVQPPQRLYNLTVCANFCEVWLAKEGHNGLVGINFLEKLQMPNLAAFYGAMLAGVNYVLMGAGIPIQVPGILDKLALHEPVTLRLQVDESHPGDEFTMHFDPKSVIPNPVGQLERPDFLAIVASHTLALMLATKASGVVNGFIVEGPTAGGHNAPPRGQVQLNDKGEPIYGERDEVDMAKMRELGRPFWMAGSFATPDKLRQAIQDGAEGVQIGTAFALSRESGLTPELRQQSLEKVRDGSLETFTDPKASPSGFPFKVALLEESLSEQDTYADRPRTCDLGYLRKMYRKPDGTVGYRCASEPLRQYEAKGGKTEDTEGRKCLCNALVANIGLAQVQKTGYVEQALVTLGDDFTLVKILTEKHGLDYSATDVVSLLLDSLRG